MTGMLIKKQQIIKTLSQSNVTVEKKEDDDEDDDSESESDNDNETKPYLKRRRKAGAGLVRIKTELVLDEDLYSMLFAIVLRPDYMYYNMKFQGKPDKKLSIEEHAVKLDLFKLKQNKELSNLLLKAATIFIFQFCLIIFLINHEFKKLEDPCCVIIPDINLGFARFITGLMMHICMNIELNDGM